METLQQKIKSVILLTRMTHRELAKRLGVSVDNLYKWKEGATPRNFDEKERVTKGLNGILEKIPENELQEFQARYMSAAKTERKKSSLVSIFLNEEDENDIYKDEQAIPGTIIEVKGRPALIAYSNESPFIGNVDGLISVDDDSMAPEFIRGGLIAITKLRFFRIFIDGSYYYIVDKNYDGILRKIAPVNGGAAVKLFSEDEIKHPTLIRNFDEIVAIFKVDAQVRKY